LLQVIDERKQADAARVEAYLERIVASGSDGEDRSEASDTALVEILDGLT
jgi:hypothetical protein